MYAGHYKCQQMKFMASDQISQWHETTVTVFHFIIQKTLPSVTFSLNPYAMLTKNKVTVLLILLLLRISSDNTLHSLVFFMALQSQFAVFLAVPLHKNLENS